MLARSSLPQPLLEPMASIRCTAPAFIKWLPTQKLPNVCCRYTACWAASWTQWCRRWTCPGVLPLACTSGAPVLDSTCVLQKFKCTSLELSFTSVATVCVAVVWAADPGSDVRLTDAVGIDTHLVLNRSGMAGAAAPPSRRCWTATHRRRVPAPRRRRSATALSILAPAATPITSCCGCTRVPQMSANSR